MKRWMWLLLCVCLLAAFLTLSAGAYGRTEDAGGPSDTVSLQAAETVIDFGKVTLPQNAVTLAAVYNKGGRMLYLSVPVLSGGRAKLAVSGDIYAEMETAKLFRLDSAGYTPVGSVITKTKQSESDIETPLF